MKKWNKPKSVQGYKAEKYPSSKNFTLIVLLFILFGIGVGIVVFYLLQPFVDPNNRSASLYDLVRTTATILGVITVGGAAAIQYRKQQFEEVSSQLNWDIKYTSLLTTAIEHLGHESAAVRRGGLYEIRRLAIDSEKDRRSILEIIACYIREKSKLKSEYSGDENNVIQSEINLAKEVMCYLLRSVENDTHDLNLSSIDLSETILSETRLISVNLHGANLTNAVLYQANLQGACITNANLHSAELIDANLTEACLDGIELTGANLIRANLTRASLTDAKLDLAILDNANLFGADLSNANLEGSILTHANLRAAYFNNTHLEGATLRAANITAEQLMDAYIDEHTEIDEGVKKELESLRKESKLE